MSGPYRDYDDDLYPRDPFSRKRDLAREVFHDEFSARERAFRQGMDMRLPPLGPDDPYFRRREDVDPRDPLARGMHFSDPMYEPPLTSPKDHLLPLDRPGPVDHFGEALPPRPGLDSMRIGSVLVFPPKKTKFPLKATEAPSRTLYVGSLPHNTTKHHLEDLFSRYGQVDYVRTNYNYAHIQFAGKAGLLKALDLDGAHIQVGPTNTPDDYGQIVVEFSIRHHDAESEKEKEPELIPYSVTNASSLPGLLYKETKFKAAAKSLKTWFGQGHCTSNTAYSFYNLLTSTNTCTRRAKKQLTEKEDELKKVVKKHKETMNNMGQDCQTVIDIFQAASQQKSRDNFTKGQRKMVSQWADAAKELLGEITASSNTSILPGSYDGPPPTKTRKVDAGGSDEIQALKREVEQLRAEKAVAIQGRDNQILSLKALLGKFKEECPEEWEKITEGKDVLQEEQQDSDSENGLEIIEEVTGTTTTTATEPPATDGNEMDIDDKEEEEPEDTSLAAAAAAYAQIRSTIGSVGQEGLGLTEPEVAIVSVLASFLAVHPLGATINEITMYFQGFNPSYNSHYLESLLRRLSKVFQLSAGTGDLPGKWWFMGFQTCYSAVGDPRPVDQEPAGTTEPADETTAEEDGKEDS